MSSALVSDTVLQSPYLMYGAGVLALAGAGGAYYSYTQYQNALSKVESASDADKSAVQSKSDQWKMYGMIAAAVSILAIIGTVYLYRKNAGSSSESESTKDKESSAETVEEDIELIEEPSFYTVAV
jgi:hypothetical protein